MSSSSEQTRKQTQVKSLWDDDEQEIATQASFSHAVTHRAYWPFIATSSTSSPLCGSVVSVTHISGHFFIWEGDTSGIKGVLARKTFPVCHDLRGRGRERELVVILKSTGCCGGIVWQTRDFLRAAPEEVCLCFTFLFSCAIFFVLHYLPFFYGCSLIC